MKIYQNKWAGHETYFVHFGTTGRIMHGIVLCNCSGKWSVDMKTTYYASSPKEHPDRWPVVGEISHEDIAKAILSHCSAKEGGDHA